MSNINEDTTARLRRTTVEALRAKGIEGQTIDSIINTLMKKATKENIEAILKVRGIKAYVLEVITEYIVDFETRFEKRFAELESVYKTIVVPKNQFEKRNRALEQHQLCVCPTEDCTYEIQTDKPCNQVLCPDHGTPLVAPQQAQEKKMKFADI